MEMKMIIGAIPYSCIGYNSINWKTAPSLWFEELITLLVISKQFISHFTVQEIILLHLPEVAIGINIQQFSVDY